MKKYKPVIIIFAVLLAICCILAISSRSIIRGLRTDGKYGPDIFSFEKREVDTIANGEVAFIPVLFEQLSGPWELCNNDEKSIQIMCEDIHSQYPEATLQDVYKTCYQDYFGAEHLMSDTAAAQQYLQSEFEECRHTDMSLMPKREPTGFRHRFTRINLACVVDRELTEEQLLALFIDAASKDNAFGDAWAEEWQKIERIALRVCPDWANEPLQTELRLAAEGNHAVRHSEAFRKAYNPHYRIVRAE